jgi:hypothetical protein
MLTMILPDRLMFGDGARGKHTAADYVSGLIRSSGRRRSRAGVTGVSAPLYVSEASSQ